MRPRRESRFVENQISGQLVQTVSRPVKEEITFGPDGVTSFWSGLILFGESSLRIAVQNFVAHYQTERNHQGLSNRLILPDPAHVGITGIVQCRRRLGGILNY